MLEYIIQIINDRRAMSFKEFANNTILRMDMMSSSPTLRSRKQPQYQTIFGGILSMIILAVFTYAFYFQLSNTINKLQITYTQSLNDQITSESSITGLQFAVAIDGEDLSLNPKKFIFELSQISIVASSGSVAVPTKTSINLQPCQLSDWQDLGQNFKTQFNIFGFQKMLCLSPDSTAELLGYAGSTTYKYLQLDIRQCNLTNNPNCDTTANINSYMANKLTTNDYFKVRFFIIDTIITPTNDVPSVKFLEKNIFMSFTQTTGTFGFINIAECTIQTDGSFLPYESITEETTSFIQDFYTNTVSISSTKYVKLNIYKATKSLTVSRTIGKLDEVLSYVGGLFSLLFSIIMFFIGSYSQMKYQIYVAQSLLTNNKGQRVTQQDFGFITYLRYAIYDWLDTFGIAPSSWTYLSNIHQIRQQTCEQMDLVYLMKRIKYLQESNKSLITQQKNVSLYLAKHMDLSQSKQLRALLTFTDNNFEDLYQKDPTQHSELQQKQPNTNGQMVKRNSVVSKEQEAQQQDYDEIVKNILLQSLLQLQKDNSVIGKKIKQRISQKAKAKLASLCKKQGINIFQISNTVQMAKQGQPKVYDKIKVQNISYKTEEVFN